VSDRTFTIHRAESGDLIPLIRPPREKPAKLAIIHKVDR